MKTQATMTSQAAGGGNLTPINPVLVECLQQLHEISRKIFELCDNDPMRDGRAGYLPDFEEHINNTADSIAEMARVDFLNNIYFCEPVESSEQTSKVN